MWSYIVMWTTAIVGTASLALYALMAHTMYVQATVPSAYDVLRAERAHKGYPVPKETDAQLRIKYPNLYDERKDRIMDGFYRVVLPWLAALMCMSMMILSIDEDTPLTEAVMRDLPVAIFGGLALIFSLVLVGLMVTSLYKLKQVRSTTDRVVVPS